MRAVPLKQIHTLGTLLFIRFRCIPPEYVPPQCLFVSLKTSVETYQQGKTATTRSQSALGTSECKGILILKGISGSNECLWPLIAAARADAKGRMRAQRIASAATKTQPKVDAKIIAYGR
jgi:hypothetical protein